MTLYRVRCLAQSEEEIEMFEDAVVDASWRRESTEPPGAQAEHQSGRRWSEACLYSFKII